MAITAEQIAEARSEGYSDAEILQHYAAAQGVDLKAARDEGYSDSEILSHFSGADVTPQETEKPVARPQDGGTLTNPALSAALGAGAGAAYSAKTIPVKAAKALGNVISDKLRPPPEMAAPIPNMYKTPSGIPVEQTPGGLHPGAVGNAQFNVEQQQANQLRQNMPSGFEQRGTSRIITPMGMQEPSAAALGGAPKPSGTFSAMGSRALNVPTQAIKQAAPAIGGAAKGVVTSSPAAGAIAGWNLQEAENRRRAGDVTGATLGYAGAGTQLLPKMKGKAGLIKPLVGLGAAGINALRGQPEGYAEGRSVRNKKDLAFEALKAAKNIFVPKETQIVRASEALAPHEGKWLNVTQSDRMRSTGGDLGGPGFSRFQTIDPAYAGAAWGVGKKPTASAIVNVNKRFPEGQAVWSPMIGSEQQHHSNQHVFDMLAGEFNRGVSRGKLTPELRERYNTRLQTAPAYKGRFAPEFDIANPEMLAEAGTTFDRRGALAEVMSGQGVGGQKGTIIDYPGIMQEMTDPMTIGAPTHSIGTRLFNLSGDVEHRPDLHSAFPYILKGEDYGVAFNPVPKELALRDWMNQFKEFKGRSPGYYDMTRTVPSQQITEDYLRGLEEAGHAEGGRIQHMAAGKLAGGLSMMPKKQQEEMTQLERQHNYFANRPMYQKAEMIGDALSGVPELAASFHPGFGLGYAGSALYDAFANTGDYGGAAVDTIFNAPGVLKPVGTALKAAAPMARAALPYVGGLGALGVADAAEAGGGKGGVMKGMMDDVMQGFAPKVAKEITPGAPHTYGPQATGSWVRDYQQAHPVDAAGLPTTREGWDALHEQGRMAQIRAEQELGRTGPNIPSSIQYMGKYRKGTPEERAAQRQSDNDTIRMLMKLRGLD